jgi:hypothetical protein
MTSGGILPPASDDPLMDASGAEPPVGATVVTFVAGILIVLAAALVLSIGSELGGVGGGFLGTLGWVGIFSGLLLMAMAFVLWVLPESHVMIGVGIIVLSVIAWFGGGGFILGSLLGLVGGLLAIFYETD